MATSYTTGQGTKTVLNRRERVTGTRGNWSVKSFGDDVQTGITSRRLAERLAAEYARIERRTYRQAQADYRRAQAAAAQLAETVARAVIASTPDPQPADRHDPARVHAVIIGQFPHATHCGDTAGSHTRTARQVTCRACLDAIGAGALHPARCDHPAEQRRIHQARGAGFTPVGARREWCGKCGDTIATEQPADDAELYPADGPLRPHTPEERAALPFTPEQLAGLPRAVAAELVDHARALLRDGADLSDADLEHLVSEAAADQSPLPDGPATIPVQRIATCYRTPHQPFSACGMNPPQRDTYRWDMVDCAACIRERDRRAAAAADAERAAAAASVVHYDTFGVPAMTGCGKPISTRDVGHVRPSRATCVADRVTCPDCLPAVARDTTPEQIAADHGVKL